MVVAERADSAIQDAAPRKGSTVTNSGVSSSTAQEFEKTARQRVLRVDAPDNTRAHVGVTPLCSAPAAFSANAGTSYTHVWLSVGGNDKMPAAL